jgi:hexosaminidase
LPEIFGFKDANGKTVTLGFLNVASERAYQTLNTLVGEMCSVFQSSPYFHIGCDETSLAGVEKMPQAKAYMARHKLASPHALFNHFVNRMHGVVKKHGKRMIVWEGAALDPVATPKDLIVMPWVGGAGTASGLVKNGYAVINAPWGGSAAFFDPYLVNGARLRRGESLLLGATSLLWEAPETRAVPFLRQAGATQNEYTWNPAARRDQAALLGRLQATGPALDRLLHGFTFETKGALDPRVYLRLDPLFEKTVTATLKSSLPEIQVRYTTDGSEPTPRSTLYARPITIRQTTTLKAKWFARDGRTSGPTLTREFREVPVLRHDGVGAAVTLSPDRPGYYGPGPQGLSNGFLAAGDESSSAGWVGWEGKQTRIVITLDLGKPTRIKRLGGHFLRASGGITLPTKVQFAVSNDGKAFRPVATVADKAGIRERGWYLAKVPGIKARYICVTPTPGGDWTFIDEVAVNPPPLVAPLGHAALGKPVTLAFPPAQAYSAPGLPGLTDGFVARSPDFMNLEWLGIEGKNFDATVDLGKAIAVYQVGANFLQHVGAGIRIPQRLDILVSSDGKRFREVARVLHKQDDRSAYIKTLTADLKKVKARFVRVVAHTNGQWVFVDEVFVNPTSAGGAE